MAEGFSPSHALPADNVRELLTVHKDFLVFEQELAQAKGRV